jgi:multidrug transporter EmrE-like cation transporter
MPDNNELVPVSGRPKPDAQALAFTIACILAAALLLGLALKTVAFVFEYAFWIVGLAALAFIGYVFYNAYNPTPRK